MYSKNFERLKDLYQRLRITLRGGPLSLTISIPGKTFLAGEYLALKGGPTLVFLSQPCFEMEISKGSVSGEAGSGGIHPDSPAGLFIRKYPVDFADVVLNFRDAYQGRGGFGASTAQFLAVYAFRAYQKNPHADISQDLDLKDLLQNYYECAWSGVGHRPSGADLIGQYKGHLTFYEKKRDVVLTNNWPFQNIEFFLLHTGNKLATHEHLKNLSDFNESSLESAFAYFQRAFDRQDSDLFVQGVSEYSKALRDMNFTCSETSVLLSEICKLSGVRAAKGCGALGADVVMVVVNKHSVKSLEQYCDQRGLSLLTSSNNISSGLQVRGAL